MVNELEAMTNQQAALEWLPIDRDKRPEGRVLVYTSRGNPATYTGRFIAEYSYTEDDDDWWQLDEGGWLLNPSDYMPLPAPPRPTQERPSEQ